MTSIDFLNKVHKSLDSQEYNLSYSPAKSKNYMLYCNGNFIGGLFDEELCFVYADSVSELLGQPEPVYRGYSSTAQHRMLVIPEEDVYKRQGYDNMFCDEHDPSELEHRPLKRYEIPASKLVLELGYSVDYEDEKEDFEPDEADTVELINGERMPWEQVKRDGIDYIALYYVNEKGRPVQILDAELA